MYEFRSKLLDINPLDSWYIVFDLLFFNLVEALLQLQDSKKTGSEEKTMKRPKTAH